jgi:mannosyltransferase
MVKMTNQAKWILGILVLIKISIGLLFISHHSIDLDEPFSIFHAQNNLGDLFGIFKNENNPPLHFLLLHFWEQAFGISPVAVRSLSLIFSVLTVFVLFKIGLKFFSQQVAVFTCLFFIFSDFHHYYGLEARTYSLLVFEYAIAVYLLLKLILNSKDSSWKTFVALGIVNIALFYTHYISLLIFLSEGFLLLVYIRNFNWKNLLLTIGISLFGVLPWLTTFIGRASNVTKAGTWLTPARYPELYGFLNKFLNNKYIFVLVLALGLIYLLTYFIQSKKNRQGSGRIYFTLSTLFIIPFLVAFMLSRFQIAEVYYDRYLFFLTVPLFFGLSYFFQSIQRFSIYALTSTSIAFIACFNYTPENNRETDQVVAFVQKNKVNNIVLFPNYYDLNFMYHFNRKQFNDVHFRDHITASGIYPMNVVQELKDLPLKGKIALVDADFNFLQPNQHIQQWFLDNGYQLISIKKFKGNFTVSIFQK